MKKSTYDKLNFTYKVFCVLITICIVITWFIKYNNHDLSCSIDIKRHFQNENDIQPAFSICTTDPKLNEKIKKLSPKHNKSTYLSFLRGDAYYEELGNIDFRQLKFNWSEYFYEPPVAYLIFSNDTTKNNLTKSKYWTYYTSYIGLQSLNRYLTDCLAVQPLTKEVYYIKLSLKRRFINKNQTCRMRVEYRILRVECRRVIM